MKRKARLAGPARKYRRDPARYEVVRAIPGGGGQLVRVTRLGCRDAVAGQKDPYKPAAAGYIAAYREGYRICDAIYHTGRKLTAEERRVSDKLSLESEIQFSPLGGTRTRRKKRRK